MKKFLYSFIIIGGFAFYAIYQNKLGPTPTSLVAVSTVAPSTSTLSVPNAPTQAPVSNEPPQNPANAPIQTPQAPTPTPTPVQAAPQPIPVKSAPTPTPVYTPPPAPTPTPTPPPKPKGQYTDGQYTGSVADAYYGNIQVQVTISGGKITNVAFLQYPSDRSYSRYVNGQAMPYLKAEAIAAQSANVDIVSGATDSSQAFQQSLASALAQAKS